MLELSEINASYGKKKVLDRISLSVGAGEVVTLIGPNAAGKSTTLRTIAGLKRADSGKISYEDFIRLKHTTTALLADRMVPEILKAAAGSNDADVQKAAAVLKAKGVSAPFKPANPADTTGRFSDSAGHWAALSARARVILYNKNLVPAGEEPKSIRAFLDPKWKGKACLANPLFGTTSMQPIDSNE
mgnify:CR=1 FL=1